MTGTGPDRLPEAARLGLRWDPRRLAAEVRALSDRQWRAQRSYGSDGLQSPQSPVDWSVLSLRSPGGDAGRTDPGGAGLVDFADTPVLARCPAIGEVLAAIPAPLRAVRLMALGPGARVEPHRDGKCGLPWGTLRLHVPVITNPHALTVLDGQVWHWDAGQLWYGDFNRTHHVCNDGPEPRVHLVIDTLVTPALLALFPEEFRRRLPYAEVRYARPPVPLQPWELPGMCRRFRLPASFADWSEEPRPGAAEVPAEVLVDGGGLVLAVRGVPTFRLVHLGGAEFRLAGWSEERTVRIAPDGTVRLRVRTGRVEQEWVRGCDAAGAGTAGAGAAGVAARAGA